VRVTRACSSDNAALLWHVETARTPLRDFTGHYRAVTALAMADTTIKVLIDSLLRIMPCWSSDLLFPLPPSLVTV